MLLLLPLPDPIQILISPPPKRLFKTIVNSKIIFFLRSSLISEAEPLTSLRYMRLSFLPLGQGAHPLWWTSHSSSSATVMSEMLSGRYISCWLRRHWTEESGCCRLPGDGQVPPVMTALQGDIGSQWPVSFLTTALIMVWSSSHRSMGKCRC